MKAGSLGLFKRIFLEEDHKNFSKASWCFIQDLNHITSKFKSVQLMLMCPVTGLKC